MVRALQGVYGGVVVETSEVPGQDTIERLLTHRKSELALNIRCFGRHYHHTMGRAARSSGLDPYQHQILEHLFERMRAHFAEFEGMDSVIFLHEDTPAALPTGDAAEIIHPIDVPSATAGGCRPGARKMSASKLSPGVLHRLSKKAPRPASVLLAGARVIAFARATRRPS